MVAMRLPLIALSALAASCLSVGAADAAAKATWGDRLDQILATFMGDPAANVDIDMKHVLDEWRSMHPKPLETLSADDARRQPTPIEAAAQLLKREGKTLDTFDIATRDVTFAGIAGDLKARIYTPRSSSTAPRPVVVFFHGGGFVLENSAGTEATARTIAGGSDVIVVAPDYRLAPEHKFPAAEEDAIAAYRWAIAEAQTFGGDPNRIAIAGEGAGGNLAVNVAIAARDAKLPKASALVLITPAAGIDLKTNSWVEDSAARPWNKAAVEWAFDLFLPNPETRFDPRIDIIGKANVDNLPQTTIVTAEDDPLRSDGERLGGKLRVATVPVAMRDYPGVTHDFFGMGAAVDKAALAARFISEQLTSAFHPAPKDAVALEDMGIAPYPTAPDPVAVSPKAVIRELPPQQPRTPQMPSTPQ